MKSLINIVTVGVSYLYFNRQYFKYTETSMYGKSVGRCYVIFTFLINYSLFVLCSMLRLHLVVNWLAFFLALCIETLILYRRNFKKCIYLAVSGMVISLAANIFFRSMVAMVMNVPLTYLDNNLSDANIKRYPIFLGFLLTGLFFKGVRQSKLASKQNVIFDDRSNFNFLIVLMLILYAYLMLSLLLYYTDGDHIFLKLWGMKSGLFVMTGYYLAWVYTVRMSQLNLYRRENTLARQNLISQKYEEKRIENLAYTDALTGFYNRQYAEECLSSHIESAGDSYCVCFVDVNGLKLVNDHYGHAEGDRYLLLTAQMLETVVRQDQDLLIRYGGDEFLLILSGIKVLPAEERLELVNERLKKKEDSADYPYRMSVSYGLVAGNADSDVKELIKEADARMYDFKMSQRSNKRS